VRLVRIPVRCESVMRIGVCVVELHIPENTSLKRKSAAEVDSHDLHQRASIGIAMVGNDSRKLNSALDKVVNYIENMHVANVIRHEIEIL
jgi:uncharacterized protein YlxP (DUF503 family)